LANELKQALQQSKNLKENLKELRTILKRVSVCMQNKPIRWLQDFHQANGVHHIQAILLDTKIKQTTNLLTTNHGLSSIGNPILNHHPGTLITSINDHVHFKEPIANKDFRLTHDIKLECIKILRSFANTPVFK
jgi:hypothetical protein